MIKDKKIIMMLTLMLTASQLSLSFGINSFEGYQEVGDEKYTYTIPVLGQIETNETKYKSNDFEFDVISYEGIENLEKTSLVGIYKAKKSSNHKEMLIDKDGNILTASYDTINIMSKMPNAIEVTNDGLIGIIDFEGNTILPVKFKQIRYTANNDYLVTDSSGMKLITAKGESQSYDEINNPSHASYFVVMKNRKLGVIDSQFNILLDTKYGRLGDLDNGNVVYGDISKEGFLDGSDGVYNVTSGKPLIPIENGRIHKVADDYLVRILRDKNDEIKGAKLYNNQGKMLMTLKDKMYFSSSKGNIVEVCSNTGYGRSRVTHYYLDLDTMEKYNTVSYDDSWVATYSSDVKSVSLKNVDGKYIKSTGASYGISKDGFTLFEHDGKFGIKNSEYDIVVGPVYDRLGNLNSNRAKFYKDGFWGFLDQHGNVAIKPMYKEVHSFSDGYASVLENGKWYVINQSGNKITTDGFDEVFYFENGYMPVRKGDKWGFIDQSGKILGEIKYDAVKPFFTYSHYAPVKVGDLWGLMDKSGEVFIEPQWKHVYEEKTVTSTSFKVLDSKSKGQEIKFIDIAKLTKFPYEIKDYDKMKNMYYQKLQNAYPNKNQIKYGFSHPNSGKKLLLDFSESNGLKGTFKFGLADLDGNVILKPIYDKVSIFNDYNLIVTSDKKSTLYVATNIPEKYGTLDDRLALESNWLMNIERTDITLTSDIKGGYEANQLARSSFGTLGSWTNNYYSKAKMNPNGSYVRDLEILDEMLEPGSIDISSTGNIQIQTNEELSNDQYAKVKLHVNSKGQTYLEIRGWAYKANQRTYPEFVLAMNGCREIIKYYSASNEDAEAIYDYLEAAILKTPKDVGNVLTFGSTKVIFSDPGKFGYDLIFVE